MEMLAETVDGAWNGQYEYQQMSPAVMMVGQVSQRYATLRPLYIATCKKTQKNTLVVVW